MKGDGSESLKLLFKGRPRKIGFGEPDFYSSAEGAGVGVGLGGFTDGGGGPSETGRALLA